MTKVYVCIECGSQIVGHSKTECDAGKANLVFENWRLQLETIMKTLADVDSQLKIVQQYAEDLRLEREKLRSLLKRSLQLSRPWMDGNITWKEWDELFAAIEKAVASER
jgi:hypothetical protein